MRTILIPLFRGEGGEAFFVKPRMALFSLALGMYEKRISTLNGINVFGPYQVLFKFDHFNPDKDQTITRGRAV